ncbi:hypothetical protein [Lichenicoccus sp.]|uniref:hypothetical protein n=1 Tax=Lichenicoccus sp. TaxID=2781899 RepID=UPI003D098D9D
MPCWPVSYRDGIYQVTDDDGIMRPITMGGAPVSTLQPGWSPVGLQTGLPPFYLLELRHDSGQDAVWYLTDQLAFITHTTIHFGQARTDEAVAHLLPLLRDIYDTTLCAERPAVAASSHRFEGINAFMLRELIDLVVETALSPPDVVMADRLGAVSDTYAAGDQQLSAGLIRHSLDVALPESATSPPHEATLRLASPFDAGLLDAQEYFSLGGKAVARFWRFFDTAAATPLYLLVGDDGAPALYIPTMNTIFASRHEISGAEAMTTLFTTYASHTDRELAAPLAAPAWPQPMPASPARAEPKPAPPTAPPANWWKRLFGLGQP